MQVPFGQPHGVFDRLVGNRQFVELLVPVADAQEDLCCLGGARLLDDYWLEAAFERSVSFDMFLVLGGRRRADDALRALGKQRLQDIGRVEAALGPARADQGMDLVDEQDYVLHSFEFGDHAAEPFFELAPVHRTGDQCAEFETDQACIGKVRRDGAGDDRGGQAFHDRGFPGARFADQDRVVLRFPSEDMGQAHELVGPADERFQLMVGRERGQIGSQLVEHRRGTLFAIVIVRFVGVVVLGRRTVADRLSADHAQYLDLVATHLLDALFVE